MHNTNTNFLFTLSFTYGDGTDYVLLVGATCAEDAVERACCGAEHRGEWTGIVCYRPLRDGEPMGVW